MFLLVRVAKMAATFVTVANPASSFEIPVYLAEGTQNVIEYIVNTFSDTIDTFVTHSAIGPGLFNAL